MNINILAIKPLFNQIITTAEVEEVEEGQFILDINKTKTNGDLLDIQKVLSVGPAVRDIKEGDMVLLKYENYAVRKYAKSNSIQDNMSEKYREEIVRFDIPSIIVNGVRVLKLYDRDVDVIISEFEEIKPSKIIGVNTQSIIIP